MFCEFFNEANLLPRHAAKIHDQYLVESTRAHSTDYLTILPPSQSLSTTITIRHGQLVCRSRFNSRYNRRHSAILIRTNSLVGMVGVEPTVGIDYPLRSKRNVFIQLHHMPI